MMEELKRDLDNERKAKEEAIKERDKENPLITTRICEFYVSKDHILFSKIHEFTDK